MRIFHKNFMSQLVFLTAFSFNAFHWKIDSRACNVRKTVTFVASRVTSTKWHVFWRQRSYHIEILLKINSSVKRPVIRQNSEEVNEFPLFWLCQKLATSVVFRVRSIVNPYYWWKSYRVLMVHLADKHLHNGMGGCRIRFHGVHWTFNVPAKDGSKEHSEVRPREDGESLPSSPS